MFTSNSFGAQVESVFAGRPSGLGFIV